MSRHKDDRLLGNIRSCRLCVVALLILPARGRHHPSGLTAAGPPEETVLETFFVMLSKMNFDKAREHCVSDVRACVVN